MNRTTLKVDFENIRIAIIGLGYVGLPLAVEFAKKYSVVGFDINKKRIDELKQGHDRTLEITDDVLKSVLSVTENTQGLTFSYSIEGIRDSNYYIITVPTPVDKYNRPVLTPLYRASETVGKVLKSGDVVVYESTVYPGATEEVCVPVLESISGLRFNDDFFVGYSPERINPGDKEHTVSRIMKVTSGSTPRSAEVIDQLYKSVITAGTFKASSIKVAEAAKVIENSQRDINIAFVNELAKIFGKIGIDTREVLEAAGTKWNFLKFTPGLVGGHCIGVDPFYLAQKAAEAGYHPEIILAGRRLNDSMGSYIVEEVIKLMIQKELQINHSKCLILGFTFKENCPDIRNTRVIDIVHSLSEFNVSPVVYDPWASSEEVKSLYGIDVIENIPNEKFEAIILAVSHNQFLDMNIKSLIVDGGVVFDVKGVLDRHLVDRRL